MKICRLTLVSALFALSAVAQPQATARFDAISIKPAGAADRISYAVNPKRLTLMNLSLSSLIELAYGIKDFQLTRPAWLDDVRFNVAATTTEALPRDAMFRLLLPELASRFQLSMHRDSKVMSVYQLVVAKGGHKLTPAEAETGLNIGPARTGGMQLTGKATLANFASLIGAQTDSPGIDATGLPGTFEFKLTYAPERANPDSPAANAPSLFVALEEQLGLKFEPAKRPIDVWVVDHCERTPVEN